ncbi:MAG: septation protein SpoVG family protein [Phycisphaerales bacterium]|nr:septation protein SpoVG family protein [Phycisphaerales bacterium]
MQLTEIRISLCSEPANRLKAFCSLIFDDSLVIRDVKLIEGNSGLFVAMPSRKICDHCPRCREKNHLRARFCNQCGCRLDDQRYLHFQSGNGRPRLKLHADIAHPIHAAGRLDLEGRVLQAYQQELARSRQPGYVRPRLEEIDSVYVTAPMDDEADHHTPSEISPAVAIS